MTRKFEKQYNISIIGVIETDIEYYTQGYVNNVEGYKSEIWLPIK